MKYKPQRVSPERWHAVRDFVIDCVLRSVPNGPDVAVRLMAYLTKDVLWAVYEMHAPLDRDDIFHTVFIRRYVDDLTNSVSVRLATESTLRRIAFAVVEESQPFRRPYSRRPSELALYNRRELAEIVAWATNHKRAHKRREALTLVGLAGGAGVRFGELPTVRRSDINRDDGGGVTIHIGGPKPRTVTVDDEWSWHFDDILAEALNDGPSVFLRPLKPLGFKKAIESLCGGPHPRPNLPRLRETWAINILATQPFADAMHLIGLNSTAPLKRYLAYLRLNPKAAR